MLRFPLARGLFLPAFNVPNRISRISKGFQVGGYHAVHLPAPYSGIKPRWSSHSCASWLNTISTWREDSLLPSSPSFLSRISDAIGRSMSWKTTVAERRLMNSGLKVFLTCFQHGFSGGDLTVEADGRLAGILCSGIGGHDEDHVSAVGFPSFVVSQYGIIHYLQQDAGIRRDGLFLSHRAVARSLGSCVWRRSAGRRPRNPRSRQASQSVWLRYAFPVYSPHVETLQAMPSSAASLYKSRSSFLPGGALQQACQRFCFRPAVRVFFDYFAQLPPIRRTYFPACRCGADAFVQAFQGGGVVLHGEGIDFAGTCQYARYQCLVHGLFLGACGVAIIHSRHLLFFLIIGASISYGVFPSNRSISSPSLIPQS